MNKYVIKKEYSPKINDFLYSAYKVERFLFWETHWYIDGTFSDSLEKTQTLLYRAVHKDKPEIVDTIYYEEIK